MLQIASRAALLAAGWLACGGSAAAQWSSDPAANLAIADKAGEQVLPKIAAAPGGGTWIGWFDHASGNYDVYVQYLDEAGVELFPHNGHLVSAHPSNSSLVDWDLLAASDGSCVLVFSDARAGSDLDVHAYRVDLSGQMLWGPDGVALSANGDFEPAPKVAETSDGHFVFAWARLPSPGPGEIVMQKLDAGGNKLLGPSGIGIAGQGSELPGFCDVVAADDGGWIVAWVRDIATFQSLRHVRAQKLSASGAALWPAPVAVLDGGSVPIAYQPVLQSDGAGGALFAWHRAAGSVFDCYVQRLDASGAELFPHDGVQCSTKASRNKLDPTLSFVPASGELLVFWNERNLAQSMWGLSGQKVSAGGSRLWGDEGVELLPLDGVNKSAPRSVAFGAGAEVFLLDDPNTPLPQSRVLALRVDGAGRKVWGAAPVVLCSTLSAKDDLVACLDASGAAALAWEDERNDGGDVYAQNVHPDGALGSSGCAVTTYCLGAPNSAGAGARIGASGSASVGFNTFTLEGSGAPPGQPGLFYFGDTQAQVPFGDGFRCVGGHIERLLPAVLTSPAGTASRTLDFTQLPASLLTPGSTWNFQLWYRDPAGPLGTSFNLTDALSATFCP